MDDLFSLFFVLLYKKQYAKYQKVDTSDKSLILYKALTRKYLQYYCFILS